MKNYSDIVFYGILIISILTMLFTFGKLILTEKHAPKNEKAEDNSICLQELNEYFLLNGYVVKYLCPINNSNKWLAILFKDGRISITILSKKYGKLFVEKK